MALNLKYGTDGENRFNRTSFDSDAANYDRVRPRYCPELFDEIFRSTSIMPYSNLIEVGAGTGQATELFLDHGCNVTAVELGVHLADFLSKKYSERDNLTVWNGDFLNYPEDKTFDLLISATAFHWIPREQGFEKATRLLKPGAFFALFWNHPIVGGREGSKESHAAQAVYEKFGRKHNGNIFDGSSCEMYAEAIKNFGFVDVQYKLFESERVLTGDEYVQLMRSYSDHITLPDSVRIPMEQEMKKAIQNAGDALKILDIMDLYLARMP